MHNQDIEKLVRQLDEDGRIVLSEGTGLGVRKERRYGSVSDMDYFLFKGWGEEGNLEVASSLEAVKKACSIMQAESTLMELIDLGLHSSPRTIF